MSSAIISEWHFWLASIVTGAVMAFAYDLLRLFRRLVRHGRLWVDAEDLLFWTLCFFASFTLLYYGNNGVIRFAAVLGAGAGMLAYELTFGKIFVRYGYLLINKIFTPVSRIIKKILKKLRLFVQIRLTKLKNSLKIKINRRKIKRSVHKKGKEESSNATDIQDDKGAKRIKDGRRTWKRKKAKG